MTEPALKLVNRQLDLVTIDSILAHKQITASERRADLDNLCQLPRGHNVNSFAGNKFLYHYQLANLMHCRRGRLPTLYEVAANPEQWAQLIASAHARNRGGASAEANVFECFRVNKGSVVMFKAATARYLYAKYSATSVLDPTAGWGGRMLGAWSLGIDYTGIDTNTNMQAAYDHMIEFLGAERERQNHIVEWTAPSQLRMIWDSCLAVDFSQISYDFVLTSPPYVNLEVYEHMRPWDSDQAFYQDFFIPLWQRCCQHIKPGGHVCFNISPRMYEAAVQWGLQPSHTCEDLKQQMGSRAQKIQQGRKQQDLIYVWRC